MFEVMLGGSNEHAWTGDFIGEVTAAEFITGTALAAAIGLTTGIAMPDAGWLKFEDSVDGKTKYVAKRPLRHTISWDMLHAVGAVWGTVSVVINGSTYKVRLLSGDNSNPATAQSDSFDHPGTHGCEWNRLMYRISAKPFGDSRNTLASEGIVEGDWASYSEADLLTHRNHGNGSYQLCQETGTNGAYKIGRGYYGSSWSYQDSASFADAGRGWRPVLELVE